MRALFIVTALASVLDRLSAENPAQKENAPVLHSSGEPSRAGEDRPWDRQAGPETPLGSQDLWYGTPGVRPGGDVLGPILDLVKRPAGLLDFRPRKVSTYLPDRDTAEFLRERR